MKKQFTFSIDTSKGYFWIILILVVFILVQYSTYPDVSKLKLENERLKTENEISALQEQKSTDSIKAYKESLKSIRLENTSLKSRLGNEKSNYKTIIIEKDAKKNTIDSYDHASILDAFAKRYKQD